METEQGLTVEALAEQVRRECNTIMSRIAFGHNKEAGELTAVLCQRMADIVNQAKMQNERAEADYDLSKLSTRG